MERQEQIQQKLITDSAFADALKAAKTPEEAYKVLLAAGFQLTMEEFTAMLKANNGALSDDQLEAVSGGRYTEMPWWWPKN